MPGNHDSPVREDLRLFLSAHAADMRAYLVDLIRSRTVNPPGDEHRAAKVLTDFCRPAIMGPDPLIPNQLAD